MGRAAAKNRDADFFGHVPMTLKHPITDVGSTLHMEWGSVAATLRASSTSLKLNKLPCGANPSEWCPSNTAYSLAIPAGGYAAHAEPESRMPTRSVSMTDTPRAGARARRGLEIRPSGPPTASRTRGRGAPVGCKGNQALSITDSMRREVRALAKVFPAHSQSYIAARLGIARSTLCKHFRADLDLARAELVAVVGAQMIHLALYGREARDVDGNLVATGDLRAMKFVLTRIGGW